MTVCVPESSLHSTIKSCDVSIFNFSRNQRPFEPITEQYYVRAPDAPFVVKCQSFRNKSLLNEARHRDNISSERCKLLLFWIIIQSTLS